MKASAVKRALKWTFEYLKDSIADSADIILFTAQPPLDLSCIYASSYGAAPIELIDSMQENQKNAGLMKGPKFVLRGSSKKAKRFISLDCYGLNLAIEQLGLVLYPVTPRRVLEFGNPKEAICEAAEKLGVDFLVVGSNGKGAIQRCVDEEEERLGMLNRRQSIRTKIPNRNLFGTVSNYCVNHAKCSVLVVRTKA